MKLEAEADGKKKSLLAEAEGFEAMVKAAESNPAIAIQYKMVDQWKEIAGEQVKAFEHINLGNITVFDGGNGGTSNFLNTLVKTVAPSLGVLDKLPIGETVRESLIRKKRKKRRRKVRKNNSNGYSLGSNKCTRQTVLGLCQNVDNAVVSFVGARFARPKTVCFVSSGRRTLPLQLRWDRPFEF